jgi:hypothetical protein
LSSCDSKKEILLWWTPFPQPTAVDITVSCGKSKEAAGKKQILKKTFCYGKFDGGGLFMLRRIIFLLAVLLIIPTSLLGADLTPEERLRIGSSAEAALKEVISLWKDGKYEELYEYGYRTNQVSLSKEDFIKRMKNKPWELSTAWEAIRDVGADVVSPRSVYVRARLGFRKKTGGETRFVTETFQMTMEGDRWRTGLYKIISCPK